MELREREEPRISFTYLGDHHDSDLGRFKHSLYRLNNNGSEYTVMFHTSNEIPYSLPENIQDPITVFSNKPNVRSDEDWDRFTAEVKGRNGSIDGSNFHDGNFVVLENTPKSLIRFVLALRPDNVELVDLLKNLETDPNGGEFKKLTDQIIAGKYLDKDGNKKSYPDDEGEMLIIRALLGDTTAKNDLENRQKLLEKKDQEQFRVEGDKPLEEEGDLKIDDLVAVHVTDHSPGYTKDGHRTISTTFDGSGQVTTRGSIHFALNHHLASHGKGNWIEKRYVVLVPLSELINENGKPTSMRAEDTYFVRSPGEPLILPLGTKVIDALSGEVISEENLLILSNYWKSMFWGQHEMDKPKYTGRDDWPYLHTGNYYEPSQFNSMEEYIEFSVYEELVRQKLGWSEKPPEINQKVSYFTRLKEKILNTHQEERKPLKEIAKKLSFSSNEKLTEEEFEAAYSKVEDKITKKLSAILKKKRVDEEIRSFGMKVYDIDPKYVFDMDDAENYGGTFEVPEFEQAVEKLGQKLGISAQRHPYIAEEDCEMNGVVYIESIQGGDHYRDAEERVENIAILRNTVRKQCLKLHPESRRMYYVMGML